MGIRIAKALVIFAVVLTFIPAVPFLLFCRWALYLRGPDGMFGFGCSVLLRAWRAEPKAVHYYSGIGPEFVVVMVRRQPDGAEPSTREWVVRAFDVAERNWPGPGARRPERGG